MKDHSCSWLIWSIALIIVLALGIYTGAKVTTAYKDVELMDVRAALEVAQASLAEANVELAFWQTTINGLAEGRQLEGAELNGRPSIQKITRIPADATTGFDDVFRKPCVED